MDEYNDDDATAKAKRKKREMRNNGKRKKRERRNNGKKIEKRSKEREKTG